MYLVKRIGSGIEVWLHDEERAGISREQQLELRVGRWLVYVVVERFNQPLLDGRPDHCAPVVDFTRGRSCNGIEVTLFRRWHFTLVLESAKDWLGLPRT